MLWRTAACSLLACLPCAAQDDVTTRIFDARGLGQDVLDRTIGVHLALPMQTTFLDQSEPDGYDIDLEERTWIGAGSWDWDDCTLECIGSEWEQAELTDRLGLLEIRATRHVHDQVGQVLADLEDLALRSVEIDLFVLPQSGLPAQLTPILSRARTKDLLGETEPVAHDWRSRRYSTPRTRRPSTRSCDYRRAVEHLAETRVLVDRLSYLSETLRAEQTPALDDLLDTITTMNQFEAHFEKYYTPEQLEALARRRDQVGKDGMRQAQDDWAQLYADAQAAAEQGRDPTGPTGQDLVRRKRALIEAFSGGDAGIEDSLRRMYAENPDLRQAVAGPEDGMGFLRAAEEAFGGE